MFYFFALVTSVPRDVSKVVGTTHKLRLYVISYYLSLAKVNVSCCTRTPKKIPSL